MQAPVPRDRGARATRRAQHPGSPDKADNSLLLYRRLQWPANREEPLKTQYRQIQKQCCHAECLKKRLRSARGHGEGSGLPGTRCGILEKNVGENWAIKEEDDAVAEAEAENEVVDALSAEFFVAKNADHNTGIGYSPECDDRDEDVAENGQPRRGRIKGRVIGRGVEGMELV